jgi:hypothetical protein
MEYESLLHVEAHLMTEAGQVSGKKVITFKEGG